LNLRLRHHGAVEESAISDDPCDARLTWAEETVPILRVADAGAAVQWYKRLGFEEEWTHRFEPDLPAFVSIRRGSSGTGVRIFLSEHRGDAEPNGLLYLRVTDIAPVATEFGVEIHDSGARHEVGLIDPDGNRIRVGALTGRPEPGYTYPDAFR
jgi:catechol 2,3-dioxygenase-like lactoylglutathione lyase family enzyme